MNNCTKRIIFNKFTIQLLLMLTLVGCSKNAMYETGGFLKNTIPVIGPLVSKPLQYAQQQENKRIAAENRRRKEAEEQRKQAEYTRWFNSLPQEKQVKIRLANQKTRQKQLEKQRESTKQLGGFFRDLVRPNTYIVY